MLSISGFYWQRHWAEHDENEAAKFALSIAEKLDTFIKWVRVSSFADFGCGPATMMLALAEWHPETSFHGFDASERVLSKGRLTAEEAKLGNVKFRRTSLPNIETTESYGVVTCLSTLHYVERIEELYETCSESSRNADSYFSTTRTSTLTGCTVGMSSRTTMR